LGTKPQRLPGEGGQDMYDELGADGRRSYTVQQIAEKFGVTRPNDLPAPAARNRRPEFVCAEIAMVGAVTGSRQRAATGEYAAAADVLLRLVDVSRQSGRWR
jgi:hypothetical protein